MKICYLADAASIHTQKWAKHFASKGNEVHIISFRNADIQNVKVHFFDTHGFISISPIASFLSKAGYILWTRKIKQLVNKINPDILHAHWATSYGLLAALTGFHPFILSTWGSDIIISPREYWIMKKFVEYSLKKTDLVTATSEMLASATEKFIYDGRSVHTIPFGVDVDLYFPATTSPRNESICIGLVKSFEEKYGVEYLIRAMKIVVDRGFNSNLVLVGDGSQFDNLVNLGRSLGISNLIKFIGKVDNSKVASYLQTMDIFVVPSISSSETFGVAVIEASSCAIPVIASDIGGLSEVVVDGETGYLIPPRNEEAIAEKIIKLIEEPELRQNLGANGRKFVLDNYDWNLCAKKMEEVYESILK
ncbi:MAG: glycosyltransferase [Candidatus Marinimicrobia bacterium]|nr:glycosyltransferase [Candidatus Neomarinimicrobiota bacterium]